MISLFSFKLTLEFYNTCNTYYVYIVENILLCDWITYKYMWIKDRLEKMSELSVVCMELLNLLKDKDERIENEIKCSSTS